MTDSPRYGEVWKTLSAIDVTDKVEKKMGLTYLSWAWAWGVLMEHYPSAEWRFAKERWCAETHTVEVRCEVCIGDLRRSMWLPVMDNKNKAIVKPNTRDISDARMRCMVKCLAMYGLGHYIYAGEDLPAKVDEARTVKQAERPTELDKFQGICEAVAKSGGTDAFRELWAHWARDEVSKADVGYCKAYIKDHGAEWLQALKKVAKSTDERLEAENAAG